MRTVPEPPCNRSRCPSAARPLMRQASRRSRTPKPTTVNAVLAAKDRPTPQPKADRNSPLRRPSTCPGQCSSIHLRRQRSGSSRRVESKGAVVSSSADLARRPFRTLVFSRIMARGSSKKVTPHTRRRGPTRLSRRPGRNTWRYGPSDGMVGSPRVRRSLMHVLGHEQVSAESELAQLARFAGDPARHRAVLSGSVGAGPRGRLAAGPS
jgi:hypothetical protein